MKNTPKPERSIDRDRENQELSKALNNLAIASNVLARTSLDPGQIFQIELIRSGVNHIQALVETGLYQRAPGCRLLLVEDDVINQRVITKLLAGLGYTATAVANGKRALELLANERFDIVFMDILMPGMSGLEATRRIRLEVPAKSQPWIVALTAAVLPEERLACTEAGADDFLAKPVRAEDLQAAIDRSTRPAESAANVVPLHAMKPAAKAQPMDPDMVEAKIIPMRPRSEATPTNQPRPWRRAA